MRTSLNRKTSYQTNSYRLPGCLTNFGPGCSSSLGRDLMARQLLRRRPNRPAHLIRLARPVPCPSVFVRLVVTMLLRVPLVSGRVLDAVRVWLLERLRVRFGVGAVVWGAAYEGLVCGGCFVFWSLFFACGGGGRRRLGRR